MATTHVTQADFNEYQRLTEQQILNHDDRLYAVETTVTEHSARLSGVETQDRVVLLAIQALDKKFDARCDALEKKFDARCDALEARCDAIETQMALGFAQVNEQLREIRYILGFLVKLQGAPLPPMPPEATE